LLQDTPAPGGKVLSSTEEPTGLAISRIRYKEREKLTRVRIPSPKAVWGGGVPPNNIQESESSSFTKKGGRGQKPREKEERRRG